MIEVACKKVFDAKRRGRRVQIGFHRKVKKTQTQKKNYTMSMGVKRNENLILKKDFFIYISMGVHRNENLNL